MTLSEKLNCIGTPPLLNLPNGNAASIDEFWNQLVVPMLPSQETIQKWHDVLLKYVSSDFPIYAIRGYNSFPPDRYGELRRGFLTDAEKFKYFYTDNFFAAYFAKMAVDNYVPTFDEFAELMKERKFPSRFGRNTAEERALLAVPQGKDPRVQTSGYKIAHIIPVGRGYTFQGNSKNAAQILSEYFPNSERSAWKSTKDTYGSFYQRCVPYDSDAQQYAIAEFLRFVHPLNYFLAPKKKNEINSKSNEIAEYQSLLDYAHNYFLSTYPTIYKEYLDMIMVEQRQYSTIPVDNEIRVQYGLNIDNSVPVRPAPKTKIEKDEVPVDIGETDINNLIALKYLTDPDTSFRKLEIDIMKIESPARGGGFKAKKIVNDMGITADMKGILSQISVDEFLARYSNVSPIVKQLLERD